MGHMRDTFNLREEISMYFFGPQAPIIYYFTMYISD